MAKQKKATRQEIINLMVAHLKTNSDNGRIKGVEEKACDICLDVLNIMCATKSEIESSGEKEKEKETAK